MSETNCNNQLVLCDWCGDECAAGLHPIEDNEGVEITDLPSSLYDRNFCNGYHRNFYQIDRNFPAENGEREHE